MKVQDVVTICDTIKCKCCDSHERGRDEGAGRKAATTESVNLGTNTGGGRKREDNTIYIFSVKCCHEKNLILMQICLCSPGNMHK